MADEILGEIRLFGGNYAPRNWAFCDGQIIAVTDNTALYSLLGNMYGGDGRTTFAYPDFRSRVPMCDGLGIGLSHRQQGQKFGAEKVTLLPGQIPEHTHTLQVSTNAAKRTSPEPNDTLGNTGAVYLYQDYNAGSMAPGMKSLQTQSFENAGGSRSHNNIMPCLGVSFIICTHGIYPERN
jgi:microcystin-dependent protein